MFIPPVFFCPEVATVPPAGWLPTDEPSLLAWYSAADAADYTLVDSKVSSWHDKSGNGRHATQADADKRPYLGTLGTKDAIEFAGVDEHLRYNHGSLISQPVSSIAVWQWLTAEASFAFDSATNLGNTAGHALYSSPTVHRIWAGANYTTRAMDLTEHYSIQLFNGATSEWHVDGSLITPQVNTGTRGWDGATIGASRSTGSFFHGKVAEYAAFSADITASVSDINSFLADKYGL